MPPSGCRTRPKAGRSPRSERTSPRRWRSDFGIVGRVVSGDGVANLLNGRTASGAAIEGKQQHKPQRSVADVFGLNEGKLGKSGERRVELPLGAAVENILAGRRADGQEVHPEKPLDPEHKDHAKRHERRQKQIAGARKRFLAAYGVRGREPTAEEVEHMKAGKMANGFDVKRSAWSREINATKAPIAYIDMILAAPKHLSVAWALAPTEAERGILIEAHKVANAEAMRYAAQLLGHTVKGKDGRSERGDIGWMQFDHYTSRPVAEIATKDRSGESYTEFEEVRLAKADPQIHSHNITFNAVLTKNGRITSVDMDRLDGVVKEIGGTYQAIIARELGRHGIETGLDKKTGATRLTAVPERVVKHFSKRTEDADGAARELAKKEGLAWDTLSPERQIAFLRSGAEASRQRKARTDGMSDFDEWRKQAKDKLGYEQRSVLRPDEVKHELTPEQRRELAYEASLDLVEDAFKRRAKISGQELREYAARGFIAAGGIGDDPGADISAVTQMYRTRGIRQDGEMVALLWGYDVPVRGKERISVTTDLHVEQEERAIVLLKSAAADRSRALPAEALDRAETAFLARHPDIDPGDAQWQKQRAVARTLGEGGAFSIAVGAAGAGKTTLVGAAVEGWKRDGRTVYGLSLAWKAAGNLTETGIERTRLLAVDPFIRRARSGKIQLDERSVVVVDEVATVGKRQMLELLELQRERGFEMKCIGDPRQAQSIEAGPIVALMERALGEGAIPEIVTSVRQRTERERVIAGLFREGNASAALAMKREDGTAELVAGGADRTIQRVADLWRERIEANRDDPTYTIGISAPTNLAGRNIGLAVRERMRDMGRLGEDEMTIRAIDRVERDGYDLKLARGDHVRVYDRVQISRHEAFASNGDTLEVRALSPQGMLARNEQGVEHFVPWDKLRDQETGHLRLNYGYAATIHSSQGQTRTEHINALVDGSRQVNAFLAYPAESRHQVVTYTVINEAADRKEISWRQPMGAKTEISIDDVWRNVATNLSRQPEKALAIDFARRASIRRGDVARMQAQLAKTEAREAPKPAWRAFHQAQDLSRLSLAVSQTIDRVRSLQQQIVAQAREMRQQVSRRLGIDR